MSKNPYTPNFHVMDSKSDGGNKIPDGMAIMWTTNGGYVGSNNGYPTGQPALYTRGLADAIAQSVNLMVLLGREKVIDLWPNPGALPLEYWDYFGWDKPSKEELTE